VRLPDVGTRRLGTPIDPGKLHREFLQPARRRARITKRGAWHQLRHTALTIDAAVGNPNAYVQAKAGHSTFAITERYVHAAHVAFPVLSSARRNACLGIDRKSRRSPGGSDNSRWRLRRAFSAQLSRPSVAPAGSGGSDVGCV
jgi:hypothetical protein